MVIPNQQKGSTHMMTDIGCAFVEVRRLRQHCESLDQEVVVATQQLIASQKRLRDLILAELKVAPPKHTETVEVLIEEHLVVIRSWDTETDSLDIRLIPRVNHKG